MPGFPNLFCVYGPNTNIVINGSIIYFSECAVNYAVECLRFLAEHRAAAMDCRPEAYHRYSALMDEHNAQMAWGISGVNSWYIERQGPRHPELAAAPDRLLAANPPTRPRRLQPGCSRPAAVAA